MSWATQHIERLKQGETVKFRPHGNSMQGRIESGQLCTISPIIDYNSISKNDIVLCKVNGYQYLHLVQAVVKQGEVFKIGNNKGHTNGTVGRNCIYGICTKIE